MTHQRSNHFFNKWNQMVYKIKMIKNIRKCKCFKPIYKHNN